MLDAESAAQRELDIAMAKLDVADRLSWMAGIFLGFAIYAQWDSWLWAILAGGGYHFLAMIPYKRAHEEACERERRRAEQQPL